MHPSVQKYAATINAASAQVALKCAATISSTSGQAKDWLTRKSEAFGRELLWIDWNANKTYDVDGRDHRTRIARLLAPKGHPSTAVVLPFLVAAFVVAGPTLTARSWLALGCVVGALIALLGAARLNANERVLLWIELSLLAVIAAGVWVLATPGAREWEGQLYRHSLVPISLAFLIVIALSKLLAALLFRSQRATLAGSLREVDLFESSPHVGTGWRGLLLNLPMAPLREPLLLLYPAACAYILTQGPYSYGYAGAALACTWLFIALADTFETIHHMRIIIRRMLFVGGQLVVSVAVLALAVARLLDIQYVTTLLESEPGLKTIVFGVVAAYAIFWFYGYWTGRILCEHVLDAFREADDHRSGARICSPYKAMSCAAAGDDQKRFVQIHGASRFAIVKPGIAPHKLRAGWPRYELDDFIAEVMKSADRDVPEHLRGLALIKQKIRFHRIASNVALAVLLVLPTWYFYHLPQRAELRVAGIAATTGTELGLVDLKKRLLKGPDDGDAEHRLKAAALDGRPQVILLAASGGGTRAALYTQSVLRGLADLGIADQLVLASGVSGGSLALAYFAAHYDELVHDPDATARRCAWERFSATMSLPFIQDALRGASEWRIVASDVQENVAMGLRTGDLLAESFERHFSQEADLILPDGCNGTNGLPVPTLGNAPLGLIFNTSVVGCFPYWECRGTNAPALPPDLEHCLDVRVPLAVRERKCGILQTSELAGSRLILTNLGDRTPFILGNRIAQPDEYLNYQVVQDRDVPLARAAALSANFPPVFSNAAIDIGGRVRYWVTDGGATDNRGVISLLYALDGALEQIDRTSRQDWPVVHVIVAEASATDLTFRQDRGIGAKFGAPEKFASQLMVELKDRIEKRFGGYAQDKFRFHYLSMPAVLRSNGGFGTHWMLPDAMRFHAPLSKRFADEALTEEQVTLPGEAVRHIIDSLHLPTGSSLHPVTVLAEGVEEDAQTLRHWIAEDEYRNHTAVWTCTVGALKGRPLEDCGQYGGYLSKPLISMAE